MNQINGVRLLIAIILLSVVGCGSDDAATDNVEVGTQITSLFVDAPVAGLGYAASSGSGKTSATGTFPCTYGEVVSFTVGNLDLGDAACGNVIFPMNLTNEGAVNPNGGAVAMGVLFKALDANSTDSVFTIPTSVQAMNFAASLNFTNFNATTDVASFRAILDEINTDVGLGINSAGIQADYATVHGPAAVAELESNLINASYVDLPTNIASFNGKYFLLTGTLASGSDAACSTAATNFYMGVGFASLSAGTGTAYRATLYEANSTNVDLTADIGKGVLTSKTLSLHASQTVSSATVLSNAIIKFNGIFLGLTGSAKVITTASSSTRMCIYSLSGQEVTPTTPTPSTALLAISNGATYDFGLKSTGSSTSYTFTVSNTGGATATSMAGSGLAAPFTFLGGTYPGTAGTCGATLASGATCTLVITYAPVSTGPHSGTVSLGYNDGTAAQTATRALQGTGASPALLSISDGASYNYGSVATGSTVDKTFTVTNSGGVSATALSGGGLAAPFTFKSGTYPGTGGTCASTLAASATCTIVVSYYPTSTGAHNDFIDLSYNDGASAQTASRAVSGTGVAPAVLFISDGPTYDYGNLIVGNTFNKTFTVTNTGSATATALSGGGLVSPFNFTGGVYPGTGGTCSPTLASAATCTMVVVYSPVSSGSFSDTIELSYNDGLTTQMATRPVVGTATP